MNAVGNRGGKGPTAINSANLQRKRHKRRSDAHQKTEDESPSTREKEEEKPG